jgi:lipoate-protein ligase A
LGYFQEFAVIASQLPAHVPVVRRITGGGAIWHAEEVTYCLVAQAGQDGMPLRVREVYPLLHGAILAGLRQAARDHQVSISLLLQTENQGDRRYRDEPRCFASPAVDDVITSHGAKVLGSAGRQRGNRILVHGSLKLASNPWDGETVAGCGLDFATAANVVRNACALALGQVPTEDDWTAAEITAREHIIEQRYGTEVWVRQRQGPRP